MPYYQQMAHLTHSCDKVHSDTNSTNNTTALQQNVMHHQKMALRSLNFFNSFATPQKGQKQLSNNWSLNQRGLRAASMIAD